LNHGDNTDDLAREIIYGGIVPFTDNRPSVLGDVFIDAVISLIYLLEVIRHHPEMPQALNN